MTSGISGPWMVRALKKIRVRPMNTLHVPSVTMKGGKPNRTIKKPLTAPAAVAARTPRTIARYGFCPAIGRTFEAITNTARLAINICPKIMIDPMDRSMPAVKMMRACAIAKLPTITVCCTISEIVEGRRKRSLTVPNATTTARRTSSELSQGYR